MSVVSLFRKASATPVTSVSTAETEAASWRNQPISPKQIVAIARFFRSKDLTAAPEAMHPVLESLAVFDDEMELPSGKVGGWPELAKLTKGAASDLMDVLHKLPNVGPSNGPVTTAQAAPLAPAPKTGSRRRKAPTATVETGHKTGDQITINGVAYVITGTGKLKKA